MSRAWPGGRSRRPRLLPDATSPGATVSGPARSPQVPTGAPGPTAAGLPPRSPAARSRGPAFLALCLQVAWAAGGPRLAAQETAPRPTVATERAPREAQESRSRIVGRVVDAGSGRPVQQALLTLLPVRARTLTDSAGAFAFPEVPAAIYRLEIRHIAYGTQTATVGAQGEMTTRLEVRLQPEAIALEPLEVEVEWRPRYLEEVGFYDRRERGGGTFFGPEWVRRWSVGAFADFLNPRGPDLLGVMRDLSPVFPGLSSCGGQPTVYIDGRPDRAGLAEELSSWEVGAVEVHALAPGSAPNFVFDPFCGAIVVWTKRWRDPEDIRRRKVVLCVPGEASAEQVTVEGTVRDDATRVPLPGSRVTASIRGSAGGKGERTFETTADRAGRYRFCDLPIRLANRSVTVRARFADYLGPTVALVAEPGGVVARDLAVAVSTPGRIVGRVLDRQTGRAVAAAAVSLRGAGRQAATDGQGRFAIPDVAAGDYVLEVRHVGYAAVAESLAVVPDRTVDVQASLSPEPVTLEPIVVTALRDRRLEARGFYERREWGERLGTGRFFAREEIERRNPLRIAHLLADVPGIRIRCDGPRACRVGSTRAAGCEQLTVYLDGVRVIAAGELRPGTMLIDELVTPGDVAAIEVYPGPSSVPAEFTGPTGRCGAVAIWTR